jgi:hypothetical protein
MWKPPFQILRPLIIGARRRPAVAEIPTAWGIHYNVCCTLIALTFATSASVLMYIYKLAWFDFWRVVAKGAGVYCLVKVSSFLKIYMLVVLL